MKEFKLVSKFKPAGDQPKAIKELLKGVNNNDANQVLLGATGTGKTFTIANIIEETQRPTLILAHNKTLAAQLYAEFKELFPENRVEYFISTFDFYQPEAYMPNTDTYIDKTTKSNMDIEMLRLSAMNSAVTRRDTIIIASVASIYGLNDPTIYEDMTYDIRKGEMTSKPDLMRFLVKMGYSRNDVSRARATFRAKGDVIEISPGWTDEYYIRIELFGDEVERIYHVNTITGATIKDLDFAKIFAANGYVIPQDKLDESIRRIENELEERLAEFKREGKLLEHQRLEQRANHDIASLKEFGMCSGIENYSRHLDHRSAGEMPYTLMDYLPDDFLMVVDESHQMIPQIGAMYNGDRARKENLVKYGFRLPSALDNRPLKFEEWETKYKQAIFVSATPAQYEIDKSHGVVVQQIIRPTGLVDPVITVKPKHGQIDDIMDQIHERIKADERVMITTITKKMAEDLTEYLKEQDIKAAYLHSEIKTFERIEIINDLRRGKYDVLIGINLLREGLDIPEVSLITILDADKEGFLRSDKSLIQIIGRAARNSHGKVIMYADRITGSMQRAIEETDRRRKIQIAHNKENNIRPKTIKKDIRDTISSREVHEITAAFISKKKLTKLERQQVIDDIKTEMKLAAQNLEFERAAQLRDIMLELEAG